MKAAKVCPYACITNVIIECEMVFQGTKHANDWYFYHDALTQMTDSKAQEWMQEKDYLKQWVLPLFGLNTRTVYASHPMDDSPELMPLNCSLFQDVLYCSLMMTQRSSLWQHPKNCRLLQTSA